MGASTTRAACAVALRLERLMRRRRARIALRGLFALRATRFLGSHDSCGAREACKIRLRARNFSSVIAYARYYFVIDANKVPLQCGQEGKQRSRRRLANCSQLRLNRRSYADAPERSLHTCPQRPLRSAAQATPLLRSAADATDYKWLHRRDDEGRRPASYSPCSRSVPRPSRRGRASPPRLSLIHI